MPGGLFVSIVAIFEFALHWTWTTQPHVVFSIVSDNIVAVAASVLIIGFVIYQLYYFFYRPVVPFTRGRTTTDRGGAILKALEGLDSDPLARIEEVYGVPVDFDAPRVDSPEYRKAWHTHNTLVRSLVNTIAANGGAEIKQDYNSLSDIYHALGACRLVAPLAYIATMVYGLTSQLSAVEHAQLLRFVAVLIFMNVATLVVIYTCHANRRDTWWTMTKQLQRDLRVWFIRNPAFLHPTVEVKSS